MPTLRIRPGAVAVLPLALFAAVLTACGTDTPTDASGPAVVTAWFHSGQGPERDVLDDQVRRFNAAHPDVQVATVVLPDGSYDEAVRQAAAAGDLPCVLDVDGPFVPAYADAGILRPLDTYVEATLVDDLLPTIVAQATVGDALYALGTFDSGLALWGNRALLEQAGVRIPTSTADRWSWEEFNAALDALAALPGVTHPLDLKLNYGAGEWFTYGFQPIVEGFGGAILRGEPGALRAAGALDDPASTAAFAWLRDLIDRGIVDEGQTTDDDFYGTRTAALSWVGHWMWEPHHEGLGADLVLLPVPEFPAGPRTAMGSWAWGITPACAEPEAAWDFLAFLLEPDETLAMTAANGAVPARRSALERSDLFAEDGPLRVFADQLEEGIATRRPVTPAYAEVTAQFAAVVAAVVDGSDVAAAVAVAVANLDAALEGST